MAKQQIAKWIGVAISIASLFGGIVYNTATAHANAKHAAAAMKEHIDCSDDEADKVINQVEAVNAGLKKSIHELSKTVEEMRDKIQTMAIDIAVIKSVLKTRKDVP